MATAWKLDELARDAGVSPRTVRYYIQRGLMAAPAFRGPDTAYGPEHLATLRAIKRLQDAYWPLEAIASALAGRTLDELEKIASGKLEPRRSVEVAPLPPVTTPTPATTHPYRQPAQASVASERVVRVRVAPGVELLIDEANGIDANALARELGRFIDEKITGGKQR